MKKTEKVLVTGGAGPVKWRNEVSPNDFLKSYFTGLTEGAKSKVSMV